MPDSSAKKSVLQVRLRFRLWMLLVPFVLYVVGYFLLMDRSRPEALGAFKNFQSTFRWARPMPGKDGITPTKFPGTTVWNEIYDPMDTLYFKFFPRSPGERQRLIDFGYDNRDLR